MAALRTVILVPWRNGDELREQNWEVTLPFLEDLGPPVFTGDSKGEWSRAGAINAAAKAAGTWDVAIIADADTIPELQVIRKAVELADRTGGAVRPHDRLHRLTPSGSIALSKKGPEAIAERHIEGQHKGGGLLVVARAGWDKVRGFDERFVGWGHEDTAFNVQMLKVASWERIPGQAWHLWHPNPPRRNPQYQDNRSRMQQLLRVNRAMILVANRAKGYNVGEIL